MVLQVRATLYCIFCGHELRDVELRGAKARPTLAQLHDAYDADDVPERPVWGGAGRPCCPRCHAQLFLRIATSRREGEELVAAGSR